MKDAQFPEKLANLHFGEEQLRGRALRIVGADPRLFRHLGMIEHTMDRADVLLQLKTDHEDLKLVQMLGMRAFNAFGAAIKLILSGYSQNGVLIMRDTLKNGSFARPVQPRFKAHGAVAVRRQEGPHEGVLARKSAGRAGQARRLHR